jgi:hypothetical protein
MSPIINHKHKGVQNLHQPKKGFLKHQRHPLQKIPSLENIYKKEKKKLNTVKEKDKMKNLSYFIL